jgi:hypothetical protein
VYVEYNAHNLWFFLWYKDYVRRFDPLPGKEKVLAPEWIPETKDLPDLSNNPEDGEKKKTKRNTLAASMEIGYESTSAALFDDESEIRTTTTFGRHISVVEGNGSTIPLYFRF